MSNILSVVIKVLRWIGAAFLALFAIVAFSTGGIISGLLFLFLGFWCSPFGHYATDYLPEKVNSVVVKVIAAVVLSIVALATFPSSNSQNSADTQEVASVEEDSASSTTEQTDFVVNDVKEAATNADRSIDEKTTESEKEKVDEKAIAEKKAEEEKLAAEKKAEEEKAAAEKKAAEKKKAADAKKAEEEKKAAEEAVAAQNNEVQDTAQLAVLPDQSNKGGVSSGNGENFDLYNIPEQQNTTETYVLNTHTMKFHHPTCSSVKKIKPENYATSSASRTDLMAQGYSPCGNCNP